MLLRQTGMLKPKHLALNIVFTLQRSARDISGNEFTFDVSTTGLRLYASIRDSAIPTYITALLHAVQQC